MSVSRTHANRLWPPGGYPDWPPVETQLREEFGRRYESLRDELFYDGFVLGGRTAAPDPVRTEATKVMAVTLIITRNFGFVSSVMSRERLHDRSLLGDVVNAAVARAIETSQVGGSTMNQRLCDWHDANAEPDQKIRNSRRRCVIRQLIQQSIRALAPKIPRGPKDPDDPNVAKIIRTITSNEFILAGLRAKSAAEDLDWPTLLAAVDHVRSECDDRQRLILNWRMFGDWTFQAIVEELNDMRPETTVRARTTYSDVYRTFQDLGDRIVAKYLELRG